MTKASGTYVHGRLRQRIVALGRRSTGEIDSARARRNLAKDKCLGPLLRNGIIGAHHLEDALEAYVRAPSTFGWIAEVDDVVLDKADRVFLAKHGRWPVRNGDFQLNGHYHKICRSLQHDWHYYDDQLEVQQKAGVRNSDFSPTDRAMEHDVVTDAKNGRENLWPFVSVLVVGLLSAPILGAVIYRHSGELSASLALLVAFAWLALLTTALALTLPRDRG